MKMFKRDFLTIGIFSSVVIWSIFYRIMTDNVASLGMSEDIASVVAMVLVCVIDWLHTQMFSYASRKLPYREKNFRILSFYLIALLIVGNAYYFMKRDILLIEDFVGNFVAFIGPIVFSYLFKMFTLNRKRKALVRAYEEKEKRGQSEIQLDHSSQKKLIDELSRENKEITGNYNKSRAVVCDNGIFVGDKKRSLYAFKGIPYARQPIGEYRFCAPEKAPDSDRVYEALYYGKSAPQSWSVYINSSVLQGEDCLTLNIWTNKIFSEKEKDSPRKNLKPVFVYFHGGSCMEGGTSFPMYDGKNLVSSNPEIVLVTVNYRLGLLGMIDLSAVEGGEKYPDSANLILLDQIEALKWIKRNISSFGGDADKVTIGGDSCGANCALLLPLIDSAKGLFNQVVAFSPRRDLVVTKEHAQEITRMTMEQLGLRNVADFENLTYEQILYCMATYSKAVIVPAPVLDGRIVPEDICEAYRQGKAKDIRIVMGYTSEESKVFTSFLSREDGYKFMSAVCEFILDRLPDSERDRVKGVVGYTADDEMTGYRNLLETFTCQGPGFKIAEAQREAGGQAWVFEWRIGSPIEEYGAYSNIYVPYFFSNLHAVEHYAIIGDSEAGRILQRVFVHFFCSGNPSVGINDYFDIDEIDWQPVSQESLNCMTIDHTGFKTGEARMEQYYRKLKDLVTWM